MVIEFGSPGILPLGIGTLDDRPGILALTIQHPPIQLFAGKHSGFRITGPRAHIAHPQAVRFCERAGIPLRSEIEIELAIPAYMGLGSEPMLGLAAAQAISLVHRDHPAEIPELVGGLGLGPGHFAAAAGFQGGGLVFTGLEPGQDGGPKILKRVEIEHPEASAWAVILHFPRVREDLPDSFETDRWSVLAGAARERTPAGSGQIVDEVFSAARGDSFESFAQHVQALHDVSRAALSTDLPGTEKGEQVRAAMGPAGAAAAGQSLAGLSIWGLIQGGVPSREIRKTLLRQVGYYGGRVMATITDNRGAAYVEKDIQLGDQQPIRPRKDLGGK